VKDRSFDELGTRFRNNIYGTRKGEIRFAILWRYFQEQLLPQFPQGPLHILDAGCGLGQVSRNLLELGHQVTLCDLSKEMLDEAKKGIQGHFHNNATFIHAPIQELPGRIEAGFDLVICHAVLEWMRDPREAIERLSQLLQPSGRMSLMFYNRDALVFRNLIRGNWRKVQSGKLAGEPGGLTPINPIDQYEILDWLEVEGLEVADMIGLRTFFDYLPKEMQQERSLEDILELEYHYSSLLPYKNMARYIHIHACRK
jgi:S-adenosylmethionine-dependent methyltransferase